MVVKRTNRVDNRKLFTLQWGGKPAFSLCQVPPSRSYGVQQRADTVQVNKVSDQFIHLGPVDEILQAAGLIQEILFRDAL